MKAEPGKFGCLH